MIVNSLVLFAAVIIGGLVAWRVQSVPSKYFKLTLVFAASYLFATTIVHLLPELASQANAHQSGLFIYVLAGFFL